MIFQTKEGQLEKAWQHLKLRKREVKIAEKEYKKLRAQAYFIDKPIISDDEWSLWMKWSKPGVIKSEATAPTKS